MPRHEEVIQLLQEENKKLKEMLAMQEQAIGELRDENLRLVMKVRRLQEIITYKG